MSKKSWWQTQRERFSEVKTLLLNQDNGPENHWNGNLLDEITTVLQCAQSMTWKGVHPIVNLVTETYPTGVKLTKQAMAEVENQIHRLTSVDVQGEPLNLGKWLIDIFYNPNLELG